MFRIVTGAILCLVLFLEAGNCADTVQVVARFKRSPASGAVVIVQTLSRPARCIPDEKPQTTDATSGKLDVDLSNAFGENRLLVLVFFKGAVGKQVIQRVAGAWPKTVEIECVPQPK